MVKRRFHHHVFVKSQPKKRKQLKPERPAVALQRNLLKVLVFLYKRLGKMRWISKIILQYLKCVNHAARLGKNQIWLDSTHFFLKWHMRALNYNWNIRLFSCQLNTINFPHLAFRLIWKVLDMQCCLNWSSGRATWFRHDVPQTSTHLHIWMPAVACNVKTIELDMRRMH